LKKFYAEGRQLLCRVLDFVAGVISACFKLKFANNVFTLDMFIECQDDNTKH